MGLAWRLGSLSLFFSKVFFSSIKTGYLLSKALVYEYVKWFSVPECESTLISVTVAIFNPENGVNAFFFLSLSLSRFDFVTVTVLVTYFVFLFLFLARLVSLWCLHLAAMDATCSFFFSSLC